MTDSNKALLKQVVAMIEDEQDCLSTGTINYCLKQLQTVLDEETTAYMQMPKDVQSCWRGEEAKKAIDAIEHCISDLEETKDLDSDDEEYVISVSVVIYELKALY